jgi:hypothetical protein
MVLAAEHFSQHTNEILPILSMHVVLHQIEDWIELIAFALWNKPLDGSQLRQKDYGYGIGSDELMEGIEHSDQTSEEGVE